jgi:hypothetical protein
MSTSLLYHGFGLVGYRYVRQEFHGPGKDNRRLQTQGNRSSWRSSAWAVRN